MVSGGALQANGGRSLLRTVDADWGSALAGMDRAVGWGGVA